MSAESEELIAWIEAALNPSAPMPARPGWLVGAQIGVEADGPSLRVTIKCADGSSYFIPVIQFERGRAEKARLARRKVINLKEFGELSRETRRAELREKADQLEHSSRAGHETNLHQGPWEACEDYICESIRKTIKVIRGEIGIPEVGGGWGEMGMP